MGEFWTRFYFENGKRMTRRQINKVMKLEEEILESLILINRLEEKIRGKVEKITCIRNGGKQKKIEFKDENIF